MHRPPGGKVFAVQNYFIIAAVHNSRERVYIMTQILLVENLPGISEQISSLSGENAMQYYELNTEDHALTAAIFLKTACLFLIWASLTLVQQNYQKS